MHMDDTRRTLENIAQESTQEVANARPEADDSFAVRANLAASEGLRLLGDLEQLRSDLKASREEIQRLRRELQYYTESTS